MIAEGGVIPAERILVDDPVEFSRLQEIVGKRERGAIPIPVSVLTVSIPRVPRSRLTSKVDTSYH
jgi:hypothetical protein